MTWQESLTPKAAAAEATKLALPCPLSLWLWFPLGFCPGSCTTTMKSQLQGLPSVLAIHVSSRILAFPLGGQGGKSAGGRVGVGGVGDGSLNKTGKHKDLGSNP